MALKKIFIDATSLYAFIDRADPNHPQITKLMDNFSVQNMNLYTSFQAVQDVYTAIERQLGKSLAIDFLGAIFESNMEMIYPQRSDFVAVYRLIKANPSRQIPIKEAMTAVLMQKRGITQVLTFTYWHNLLGLQSYLSRF